MAGIIDPTSLNWTAKHTILISTGDSVDRGSDTIAVYALWRKLARQAPSHHSEVVNLLGNHEVLNLIDDPKYIWQHAQDYLLYDELRSYDKNKNGSKEPDFETIMKWRRQEFSIQGTIGKQIRSFNLVHQDGGMVFLHGGISKKYALMAANHKEKIDFLNIEAIKEIKKENYFAPILRDIDSPLWYIIIYKKT
jgi:hypothetical protein